MISAILLGLAQAVAGPAPIAADVSAEPKKDRLICVKEEVIGSRTQGKRMCYTPAEYEAYRLEMKQKMSERQKNGYFQESRGACRTHVDC